MHKRLAFSICVLWGLILLASLGILLAALPGYVNELVVTDPAVAQVPLALAATWLSIGLSLSATLVSLTLAGVLFWKKAHEPMALYLSFFLLLWGVASGPAETLAGYWFPPGDVVWSQLDSYLWWVPLLVLILIFPTGRFVPRWTLSLPLLAGLLALLTLTLEPEETLKLNTLRSQTILGALCLLGSFALGIQAYRYRTLYTPVERQQTKWLVYGTGLWIGVGTCIAFAYFYLHNQPAYVPPPWWAALAGASWFLFLNILPVSFTLAIMRSRLWDIDFIIHRTVTYALLTALLVVVYFGGVVILQRVFVILTGQRSDVAIILSTLAIAALFVPLRSRIQAIIDRRFFRAKYDAATVLESFARSVRDEVDTTQLTAKLLDSIEETLNPESVSLWLRETPVDDPAHGARLNLPHPQMPSLTVSQPGS